MKGTTRAKPRQKREKGAKKVVRMRVVVTSTILISLGVVYGSHSQFRNALEDSYGDLTTKDLIPEDMSKTTTIHGANINTAKTPPQPRFVTVVLPSVVNEKGATKRLKAIQETWGPAARTIFVTPAEFSEVGKFPDILAAGHGRPPSSSEYPQALILPHTLNENNVPRLKYIIEQIHTKINPDFAFFVNDHTYVIPDHLCEYLKGKLPTDDLYAGHALQTNEHIFNSGAAGYLLSRQSMTKLVEGWSPSSDNLQCTFVPDKSSKKMRFLQKSPGLFLTSCLRQGLNIAAVDTREGGRYHRFHAFPLTRLVAGKIDGWYLQKHTEEAANVIGADPSYTTLLDGEDCCATASASFHYIEDAETRALFAIRQRLINNPSITDPELQEFVTSLWPSQYKEFGGYNQGLPATDMEQEWRPFLRTLRKISRQNLQQTC